MVLGAELSLRARSRHCKRSDRVIVAVGHCPKSGRLLFMVSQLTKTWANQITGANAGQRQGFAKKPRVGKGHRPGVAQFQR